MDLMQDVKNRLLARKGEWKEISKASGVSLSWVVKFVDDQIANPGHLTLIKLNNYFRKSGRKAR